MNNKLIFLLLLASIFIIFGCKTQKKLPPEVAQLPKIAQVDSVFASMKNAEYNFQTLVLKFSGIYSFDESKQNFSGQMRLVKDSAIWCSLTVMNIEVARVLVCRDTVKMLNKINRQYIVTDFQYINSKLNTDIDFDMLQALILGNDIPYYETDKFQLGVKSNYYELQTIGRKKLKNHIKNDDDLTKVLIQIMQLDKQSMKILQQDIKQIRNPNKKVEATYSNFENYDGLFPTQCKFKFVGVKDLNLSLEYLKVDKNIQVDLPFKIPSSYTIQEIR